MPNLTIIADIHADPAKVDLVKAELEKLIPTTRAEAGCAQYDLHVDNKDPAHFIFYEIWESKALMKAHLGAPHLKAFMAATDGAITKFTLTEMTKTD